MIELVIASAGILFLLAGLSRINTKQRDAIVAGEMRRYSAGGGRSVKVAQNIPLVSPAEQTHWPSVGTDHNLPLHHARTEAAIGALLVLAISVGAFIVFDVRIIQVWLGALFVAGVMFLGVFLVRYEHHIGYVRDDRRPAHELSLDLDGDGVPDRVHGVWFGNGAPVARHGTLSAVYSLRFAEFIAACQRGGTTVRALRAAGFDDDTQALFQGWLMNPDHPAAQWVSSAGHNPGWELADDAVVRRVLRCTFWQADL